MFRCLMLGVLCALLFSTEAAHATTVRGEIRDAESGQLLPARLYLNSADGTQWFFAKSADTNGSAIAYDRGRDKSIEKHTTLSAHPFTVELPPGKYLLTVERGKEYFTATQTVEVGDKPVEVTVKLRRWINMAERGWYSGDTHVHRAIADLPNVVLAEDLNMIYPMSQWVTVSHMLPEKGRVDPQPIPNKPIFADSTHAIVPLNTEYEIFSVTNRTTGTAKPHTLGAVLVLGHKRPLPLGIPPMKAVAEEARQQGALLDLEKHSWAWTPIIAPVMKADLYPLSNNHVWRTEFGFPKWTLENNWRDNPRIETNEAGFTELGWLHFGWEQYYALLNCDLRMRPTAGTASGVHPVPAGFSRVYVDLGQEKFSPELWQKRLNEGRSFVTTGPMLFPSIADLRPGERLTVPKSAQPTVHHAAVRGRIISQFQPAQIELVGADGIVNLSLEYEHRADGAFVAEFGGTVSYSSEMSSWAAVRCFERLPDGRLRFAHSAPVYFECADFPVRPIRDQVRYLIQRCEEEIARNKEMLSDAELSEYREALEFYRSKLATAR